MPHRLPNLEKGGNVNTDVLLRICNALNCDIGDIMEFVREENLKNRNERMHFLMCKTNTSLARVEKYSAVDEALNLIYYIYKKFIRRRK